jgi:hypothetical protein
MERQGRSSSDLQKLKSGSHDDLVAGFFNGIGPTLPSPLMGRAVLWARRNYDRLLLSQQPP